MLSLIPVVAIVIIAWKTVRGSGFSLNGGPFCFIKFGMVSFVLSALFYLGEFCPRHSRLTDFTWYDFGISQWQLLGFIGMILCGAIYHILPRVMEKELPWPKAAKASFFILAFGVLLYVVPLLIGGREQGLKLRDSNISIADVNQTALFFFRISTTGQLLVLFGALCLLLNIFVMTFHWKWGLFKSTLAAIKAPLETRSATQGEAKP
jgi:cytochrome c oxidase cbb3-type subunit 1